MKRLRLAAFAALAALSPAAGPACAVAETPVIVLSSESEHYRKALEGFVEEWGSTVAVAGASEALPVHAWAFAAIGGKAASRRWPSGSVVVACLSPSAPSDPDDDITRVSLLADPGIVVDRLRTLAPGLKVLRVLWSSESSREDAEALNRAAAAHGIVVLSERVDPPGSLPEKIRAFEARPDALWLMPDPALVTAENFAILREYSAAAKVPFFAPTEGLAERGATATISASFRDMGRAAAAALRDRLAARPAAEVIYVPRVSVTVNASAPGAAGLGGLEKADKVLR